MLQFIDGLPRRHGTDGGALKQSNIAYPPVIEELRMAVGVRSTAAIMERGFLEKAVVWRLSVDHATEQERVKIGERPSRP